MESLIMPLSNTQVTVLAAIISAITSAGIAAMVSIFTTRYAIKHGPNYEEQIEGLNEKFEAFHETYARTQSDLMRQQAEFAEREDKRYQAQEEQIEAAKWRPRTTIIRVIEGQEPVNKLSINAVEKFRLLTASIHSSGGAKLADLPGIMFGAISDPVVGINVPIPHSRLLQLSQMSASYATNQSFDGSIKFTVERAEGEPVKYSGEVTFTAVISVFRNTQWFNLIG